MTPGFLSFTGDDFESILRYSDLFLPGIQKIAGIYYSNAEAKLKVASRFRDQDICHYDEEILSIRENVALIQRQRADRTPFNWIRKEEVPFEFSQEQHKLNDIFSEIENVVLVLRFKSDHDQLHDILYVYFNKNFGNFGIKQVDKVLTVDNKIIIANLLHHQFKSLFRLNRENKQVLTSIANNVRALVRENTELKGQLEMVRNSYGESIINLAEQFMAELSQKYNRNYILADDAVQKIRQFKGNLRHLPVILENAIIFMENLGLGQENGLAIFAHSLDFDSYQVQEKTGHFSRRIDSRQSRAMQLLDRLEKAALKIKGRNQALKSASIGKELDPPVTAPAITDALAKNRDTILRLLDRYPERWEIIRKEFRPLNNLVNKKSVEKDREASA